MYRRPPLGRSSAARVASKGKPQPIQPAYRPAHTECCVDLHCPGPTHPGLQAAAVMHIGAPKNQPLLPHLCSPHSVPAHPSRPPLPPHTASFQTASPSIPGDALVVLGAKAHDLFPQQLHLVIDVHDGRQAGGDQRGRGAKGEARKGGSRPGVTQWEDENQCRLARYRLTGNGARAPCTTSTQNTHTDGLLNPSLSRPLPPTARAAQAQSGTRGTCRGHRGYR